MLPRQIEHERRNDQSRDGQWERFQAQSLLGLLQVEYNPLDSQESAQEAYQAFLQTLDLYADHRNLRTITPMIRNHITDYLLTNRDGTAYSVNMLDRHLSAVAYLAAQVSDEGVFAQSLQDTLGTANVHRYEALASAALGSDGSLQDIDMNYRELNVLSVIFRNISSFGMWKSIELSKRSRDAVRPGEKQRAYVGSVALDHFGSVVETGYRGEDPNRSRHSEDILLGKLRQKGLMDRVSFVSVNLEPCAERSEKHRHQLGHTKGCSQLLLESGIPVIGYVIGDGSRQDRGRGAEVLTDSHQVLLYRADVPIAIATTAGIQHLPHLKQVVIPFSLDQVSQLASG